MRSSENPPPRVRRGAGLFGKVIQGVGVIVVRDNRILLGRRKGSHARDTWAPPGGRKRQNEYPSEAAKRELQEETSLIAYRVRQVAVMTNFFEELNEFHKSMFFEAEVKPGEVVLCEPDKCHEWDWFDWNDLPKPLFPPLQSLYEMNYIPTQIKENRVR